MHPLLRLAALTIAIPVALVSGGICLAAWGILDPEPRRELFGSGREWLRAKIREFTRA